MEDLQREELLRIEHLSVTFTQYDGWFSRKTLPVIRDLSLRVSRGEMVAVVGSSGSGKSLLAHAVMGVLPYNGSCGGDIYYKGKQLTTKRIKQLRGNKIVLVPQSVSYLDPLMKVGEQVAGGKDRISLEKSRKALTRYGLDKEVDNMYPFELSGGLKRRVAIAGVLAMEPKVLILDEPTAGLDPRGRDEILSEIKSIHEKRKITVILVSHSMEDVAKIAERIIVMDKGKVFLDSNPREIFRNEDKLLSVGLGIPQITSLMRALKKKGLDINEDSITVEEAKESLIKYLRGVSHV